MTKHKTGFTYGHWTSFEEIKEDEYFGFVYLITNKVNGKKYVGKKQYYSYRKRKKHKKMPWKDYKGSSKDLHKDISKYGKKNFKFEILFQCSTRGSLAYEEANLQHRLEVLTAKLPCGDRAYYNKNIAGIKFAVKEELSEETKKKISEYSKGMVKNTSGLIADARSRQGRLRRSETMKKLNKAGKAYRRPFGKVKLYFKDGTKITTDDWPSYCEKNGYTKHGIWNMTKGRQKTMRKNGKASEKDVIKVEWTC